LPFTLVGWAESQDTGGVLTLMAALADPHVRVQADDVIIPELANLMGCMAVGTTISNARIGSPELRRMFEQQVNPLNLGAEPLSPPLWCDMFENPIPMKAAEALNAYVAETAVGAELEFALAWLGDAAISPYRGPYRTIRATNATTLVVNAWTNGALTFDQTLPAGRYQVVGMWAMSAGLIAARLCPVGGGWRPGVIGGDALSDIQASRFRFGNAGVFMEFAHNSPPTVDFLSISADNSQTVFLDLVGPL